MSSSKKSLDEQENERLFAPRTFTFEQYVAAIGKEKSTYKRSKENCLYYNGTTYGTIMEVRMAILYDMCRHLLWKSTSNTHDIVESAFYERGWEALPAAEPAAAPYSKHFKELAETYDLTDPLQVKLHLLWKITTDLAAKFLEHKKNKFGLTVLDYYKMHFDMCEEEENRIADQV